MNRLLFIFLCTITFTRSYYVLPNFFHGTLGNGVSRSNRNHKQLLERIISIPLALTNRNNDAAEEPVEQVACRESVGSYNEDSVPGVDIDSECHNSTDNCSGSDSVHLKLYELGSLRDNSDKDNLENSDPSHPALSSPYTNSTTETVICEYVNSSNGSVILACFGSKYHLEYFSQYVYGLNYSEIAGAEYREIILDTNDSTMYQKYQPLWTAGKLLTQMKSLKEQLMVLRKSKDSVTTSFSGMIQSNIYKVKQLVNDTNGPAIIANYLRQLKNISGNPIDSYYYSEMVKEERSIDSLKRGLKKFCEWFRGEFPYYYDQCTFCGNKEQNDYLGTVYPNEEDLKYLSSRTELYLCSSCGKISPFSRYNDVCKVLETRRGRCGEYSVLMMLFLQQLGYRARWVVDRDDHVWTEVWIANDVTMNSQEQSSSAKENATSSSSGGRWVHIDPCEAAVDEPLIYQSWGKNQTYIISYEYPSPHYNFLLKNIDHGEESILLPQSENALRGKKLIRIDVEDVTEFYTTNYTAVLARRQKEGVNESTIKESLSAINQLEIEY